MYKREGSSPNAKREKEREREREKGERWGSRELRKRERKGEKKRNGSLTSVRIKRSYVSALRL